MFQVIHLNQPGIIGSFDEIVSWAKFNNMQYGGSLKECGFANFLVQHADGSPICAEDSGKFAAACRHRSWAELLEEKAAPLPAPAQQRSFGPQHG